jgi:hypothetical protein
MLTPFLALSHYMVSLKGYFLQQGPWSALLHVKIAQLDKCRMSLSIVVSVASALQLSQVSQVGH